MSLRDGLQFGDHPVLPAHDFFRPYQRDHGLAELLVDDDRSQGRIYGLTDDGEIVAAQVPGADPHPDAGGGEA
ncbi:hypothetical protein ACFQJ7_13855 [Halovenus rubra]|uniref:Uncharacterized protein n=2 Tax=Halovenus rubra TaxID=869890 RepID=A0ACC7DYR9_9EURY|nr:hypothetical protein [Halovenus rubra]